MNAWINRLIRMRLIVKSDKKIAYLNDFGPGCLKDSGLKCENSEQKSLKDNITE